MASIISCDSLTKTYGIRPLFTNISFGIDDGDRVGLIGPNGAGKSTLLQIIAGIEHADEGNVVCRRGCVVAYAAQKDEFEEGLTVKDILNAALKDCQIDEEEKQIRVSVICGKAGFKNTGQMATELSGGWKKRLALAAGFVREPELLLLDEPTNHLDIEGIIWLEEMLRETKSASIIVSHDRYLLERAMTRIIEISTLYPDGYYGVSGVYSDFLMKRDEFMQNQISYQSALQAQVRQEVAWLQRGARARTTKAKGRIEDAMELISELGDVKDRNNQQRKADINFSASGRRTKKLMKLKNIKKSFAGITVLKNVDYEIDSGMRIGLLGQNGSGKTTLLRMITGELPQDEGDIWRADDLKIVYFRQHRDSIDPTLTLRQALSPTGDQVEFRGSYMHVVTWAKKFLFTPEQLPLPVGELSGGERARIHISHLVRQPADILILDEPTNDLDIPSLEVLEDSLANFPGTLILVTHDRYMLDKLSSVLWALDESGNISEYADFSQWERAQTNKPELKKEEKVRVNTRQKKLTWAEQRELESIESVILEAEEEAARLEASLIEPEIYSDHRLLNETQNKMMTAQEKVRKLYERWEELENKA
ncbi:MAG: ABC-F family ATP-binding cassette domain-containing protein [bacterium]